jgi:HSP20 family protein
MTLIRWKPVRSLDNIQDEVNRVFDSFFDMRPYARRSEDSGWYPEVDIVEDKDKVVVNVDLPGIEKEDIKVSVHDNTLTIKGERKAEKEEKDKNYHRVERVYGTFCRSFSLPSMVDGQKIKAAYKNGVLSIDLPKAEEVKPKEIPINVG